MIPVEIGPRREGDEVATVADTARIKAELGFVPQHSSLENIIQTSWAAYQQSK
jgi:UDP-glucose 4-epimerase